MHCNQRVIRVPGMHRKRFNKFRHQPATNIPNVFLNWIAHQNIRIFDHSVFSHLSSYSKTSELASQVNWLVKPGKLGPIITPSRSTCSFWALRYPVLACTSRSQHPVSYYDIHLWWIEIIMRTVILLIWYKSHSHTSGSQPGIACRLDIRYKHSTKSTQVDAKRHHTKREGQM